MFETHSHTYGNGVRFLRVVAPLRMAAVHVSVGVGSRHEDAKVAGISHLSEHVRFRGTRRFPTGAAVNAAFDLSGGDHNAVTGSETMSFYVSALPEEILAMAVLIADLVAYPLFRKTELEQERPVVLQEISTRRSAVEDVVAATIFGPHPTARPVPGTRATVSRIQATHLEEHHQTYFVGPNVVVVVVAPPEISTAALIDTMGALSTLPDATPPPTLLFEGHEAPYRVRHVVGDAPAPNVTLIYPSCGHRAPDAMLTSMLVASLERISGPVFQRLRHELGLLYHFDVASYQIAEGGGLIVRYKVSSADIVRATHEMLTLLHRLGSGPEGLPVDVFEATKKSALTWAARLCDNSEDLASFYASELLWGSHRTPAEWVRALGSATVSAVSQRAAAIFRESHVRLLTSGTVPPRLRAQVHALFSKEAA